jgi:asparagine synthase (glutamine-hydrolysing)
MCGILGIVSDAFSDRGAFESALSTLKPRGPDDQGVSVEQGAMLGHTRLSILDLSSAGHQPMVSADQRFVIVFNGEIYNFEELRRELEAEGVPFRSHSDTEVIVELFARRGEACVERLRGMFAFAIWDRQARSLFLARDRLGIKPLYVFRGPGVLAFASELKALCALPNGPSRPSKAACASFLAWGSVPTPLTMLEGVSGMAPASVATFQRGEMRERTYWDFPSGPPRHRTRDEAIEALRPELLASVKLRCIADVPLGAFLSGGIDSSAVVQLMRSAGQSEVRTFSLAFPGTELDESHHASEVARRFETQHSVVPVTDDMVRDCLPGFFAALDQPTCDGINTYLVSKFAKQSGLTVALSGLGGDELFGGYPSFRRAARLGPLLARTPRKALGLLPLGARLGPKKLAKLEVLGLSGSAHARLYALSRGLFAPHEVTALLGGARMPEPTLPEPVGEVSAFHGAMQLELRRYTHDQLLRDSDVFGMAHALEIRVPLLDHRLVEVVSQCAPELMLRGHKALLLDALPRSLPRSITHRPKMGFTFPFDRWMRGPFRSLVEPVLRDPSDSSGLLCRAQTSRIWEGFLAGRVHWSRPWTLFVLGRFLARFGA